jgi:hypothetical protein
MRLRYLLGALGAALCLNASAAIPASEQAVAVEFYHAQFDHYFISADPKEINDLDTGVHKGWTRTGYRFAVMKGGSSYAGTSPVCRAFNPSATTHVYSAIKSECDDLKNDKYQGKWIYESDEVFRAFVVDPATGVCGADTTPTYRLWNNREDSNHRYTDQVGVFLWMKDKNYVPEGNGSPAIPVFFCTPSGGDVVPVANESAPNCTVSATSSTPALGSTLNLTATCTNSPTSFMWQGCTATTATCTSTKAAPGSASYTLYAVNASGPSDPVTLTVNWGGSGGGGGAVPICTLAASTLQPNVGAAVTLTASCNNSPASYEWMLCSATIGNPNDPQSPPLCNLNPNCASTSPTCAVSQAQAGPARYAVDAKNSAGAGPKVYIDMAWAGNGNGGGGGGGGASVPVCSISSSSTSPSTGSTITLTATCSGGPTAYDWIGAGLITPCAGSTCQASWTVAQAVTYGVSGINSIGTGGRAYVGVNWTQTTPQPPACTLSASNTTPQVGQTITITSSCSNSPTTWTWKAGCTSTTSSCTDSAAAAGPKTYTMSATNAVGNSPDASVVVNWQPLPTAPPACTVTSSNMSPSTGQNITLTASCTNAPTSYAWSGCTSSTSTCSTTSASAGSVTYGVTATNQIGTSPQATVQVTWSQSTGGANYCGVNTRYIDIPWGSTTRYLTSANGGFPQGKVFVFSITVPAGQTAKRFDGQFAPAEYQGPPAIRSMTLSENMCDWGVTSPGYAVSGTAPFIYYDVDAPMVAGKTYYFSLRNENCGQSSCDMSVTVQWPHD